MKNKCYFFKILGALPTTVGVLLFMLFIPLTVRGQFTTPAGTIVTVTSNRGGVCGTTPPQAYNHTPWAYDNAAAIQKAFSVIPPDKYFKAKAGEPVTITVNLNAPYASATTYPNYLIYRGFIGTNGVPFLYDQDHVSITYNGTSPSGVVSALTGTFTFARGATQGWIIIRLSESNAAVGSADNQIILPFVVEGIMDKEVPILGTTVEPKVPYMVLHDPPGDGSFTEFQTTETTCRSFESTVSNDESNMGNASVKLGVKGSIGIIATVDYEIYAEFKGSAGAGDLEITTKSNETCITIGKGFSTSDANGAQDGSDVFIGYGMDVNYGVFRSVKINTATCAADVDTGLVYLPIPESLRQFTYTREGILSEITELQAIIADTMRSMDTVKIRERNHAQNQIEVWNQVLRLNEENKNSSTNQTLFENISFSGGAGPISRESAIEITDTKSIVTEHYIDGSTGVQGVVNVAGSGFSGGYEYKSQKRFGETTGETGTAAKSIKYTFKDDDANDKFNVDVVRDPMFGTPVFRLKSNTSSSCPYEGGYQRDQPKLKHNGQSSDTVTQQGVPVGTSATFKMDLCNESNEARTYNLKLNAQSNLGGAVVTAAGVPLNGNDLGQSFTVLANSCVEDLVVEIRQLSALSPLAYPNLEIFMYAPCDEDITSSVFASVYFGNATATKELLGDAALLSVFPNPTSGLLQVDLAGDYKIEAYQLSDITGKVVKTVQMDSPIQKTELDLTALPKGVFVLQVRSGERVFARKVMVQ